jgi:hypothetical protein
MRIVKWDEIYENNRTRELKTMEWVPIPNKMDGDGYTELLDHQNGAAHFGVWIALVEIASKCKPRGTLLRKIPQEGAVIPQEGAEGFFEPHNSGSLARISRIPRVLFDEVIPRLKVIGWIEYITYNQVVPQIPQEGAVIPQEGASSRARSARFRSLPFPSVPERESEGKQSGSKNGHRWKSDKTLPPFLEAYAATGKALTDYDWAEAWHEWRVLDIGQQMAAVAGVTARIEAGLCAEPEFVMLPKNYLKKREWTRAIVKRKTSTAEELKAYWNS